MSIIRDIIYDTRNSQSQVLDLHLPDGDTVEAVDVLIYFHGGGLENGDKSEGIRFEHLTNAGKIVISANYRMYPTAVFPEFIEDAAAVVNWAKKNLSDYRKVNRFFVSGSSAGAYLTAMLAYDAKYLSAYNIQTSDITGYIIDSAQMTTHFNVLRERGLDTRRIIVDEAAPIYHINENTVFPNALVLVSDNDMACRLEQNLMFLKTTEMFGCPGGKIQYKLMEGFRHCEYTDSEMFADLILQYMDSIK